MPLSAYAVNALIAAALGAGTNELAIIAILRYILPRKKGEIARRIRDIVATELITPERMRDKLDEPGVADLLFRNVDQTLEEFLGRDLPSPDELLAGHRDEVDRLAARLRDTLGDEYARRVADPDFAANVIRPFLAERRDALLRRTPRSLLTGRADSLPGLARDWVASLADSDAAREACREVLDGWLAGKLERSGSAADFLSPGLVRAAEEMAASYSSVVIGQLTDAMREPGVQRAIADAVMGAIRQQLDGQGILGGIKGAFVSAMRVREDVDGVCRRLPDTLLQYFHRPENHAQFAEALRGAVRRGLAHELDGEFKSPGTRRRLIGMIMDRAWTTKNFSRAGARAADFARASLSREIGETFRILGADPSSDAVLDEATERCRRVLAAPAARELLARQIDEFAAAWRGRPLGRLGRFVSPETRRRVAMTMAEEARGMLRSRLAGFAEEAGVWDIVTRSIEEFDDGQLSRLVQQLARSELRWVTALGGIIGAVVGLAQTWLQSLGWFG